MVRGSARTTKKSGSTSSASNVGSVAGVPTGIQAMAVVIAVAVAVLLQVSSVVLALVHGRRVRIVHVQMLLLVTALLGSLLVVVEHIERNRKGIQFCRACCEE